LTFTGRERADRSELPGDGSVPSRGPSAWTFAFLRARAEPDTRRPGGPPAHPCDAHRRIADRPPDERRGQRHRVDRGDGGPL